MRIAVQELTRGCGEWCACLFDRFGQPLIYTKSTVSAEDAENRLEGALREAIGKTIGFTETSPFAAEVIPGHGQFHRGRS